MLVDIIAIISVLGVIMYQVGDWQWGLSIFALISYIGYNMLLIHERTDLPNP